jgi:serine protease Do
MPKILPPAFLCLTVVVSGCAHQSPPAHTTSRSLPRTFSDRARTVVTARSMSSLFREGSAEPWTPAVNRRLSRGGETAVFERVAPAVVVVRTDTGHGSGFLISSDGFVVTNDHVVREGLRLDETTGTSYAMVHTGTLQSDGTMALDPEPTRADFYKADPARDLALLKLRRTPSNARPIELAAAAPRPAQEIAMIGHPSAGMLWTYRTARVASVGRFPSDLIAFVMHRLASADAGVAVPEQGESTRIVMSSVSVNPGDSGGPAVDAEGNLVAVTFGGPARDAEDKFAYQVHLEEVREFLRDVPTAPSPHVPDPWALGPTVELFDLDKDGRPDVLAAGNAEIETYLFDIDNDTPADLASDEHMDALIGDRRWDFEVALRIGEAAHVLYDRDGDGSPDLVTSGEFTWADTGRQFVIKEGRWHVQSAPSAPVLSHTYLTGSAAKRFEKLLELFWQ